MTIDTIEYSNAALKDGKSILIEGANATSTYIAYLYIADLFFMFISYNFYHLFICSEAYYSPSVSKPIIPINSTIRIPLFLKLKFLTVYSD